MDNNTSLEKDVETSVGEAAPATPTTSTTRSPLRRLASQRTQRGVLDDDAQHTKTEIDQEDKSLPPSDKEEEGGDGNAPRMSNLARYFWSRLDVATQLFKDDRDDECRELVLETLMRAMVPHACRCELLHLLACVMPWKQAQDCLDEAEELCEKMERLVPGSELVIELRAQGANVRQAVKEYHETPDDDEPTPEESGQGEGQSC